MKERRDRATTPAAPSAVNNPVLRTPYEAPAEHWRLDPKGRTLDILDCGRRPSFPGAGIPEPVSGSELWGARLDPGLEAAEVLRIGGAYSAPSPEPHRTINELRELLDRWRAAGKPDISPVTERLLHHWSSPGSEFRPFWCQLEAAETVIWLFEAGPRWAPAECSAIRERLASVNARWNHGVPRLALKLATGTGKTNLMAMLALWWTARREGPVDFLALAPNLTVRERLKALDPKNRDRLWQSITPPGFERVWRRMRWSVLNFQRFQRRSGPAGMEDAGGKEKKFLRAGLAEPASWNESPEAMLDRLLRKHRGGARFVVFNDEAHHCYAPTEAPGKLSAEEKEERRAAALWFSALRALHESGRLEQAFDLSATPMWLRRPADLRSEIFPWTVSDFPLLDAIESGLVKIPRLPVADDADLERPMYRNIYLHAKRKDCSLGELQGEIREPLEQLYDHYEKRVEPEFRKAGILPILIVVANTIRNAERLYHWIAGRPRGDGLGSPGNLPLLSNYGKDGAPRKYPPTLLVHSKLSDPDPLTGKLAATIEEQAALHAPKATTSTKRQEAIREIFSTAGRTDEAGEHLRCIVSVGMLTEGWDAKNVTHIFGYRRFGSLLLCEQVTGRALRRTSFSGTDEPQQPEYANVFGVPYTFARGEDEKPPPPPVQPWKVYPVPGRLHLRIQFPLVVDYARPETILRFRFDPAQARPHRVPPRPTPDETTVAGPTGQGEKIDRDEREETSLWRAAGRVALLLDPQRAQRRTTFRDALRAARAWLALPQIECADPSGLQFDEDGIARIAEACERQGAPGCWRPVFADERDRGEPRFRDTRTEFETVLPHRHEASRSELNAAACHTAPELQIAVLLDTLPGIEAWARNFRLGWYAPWFDRESDEWRRTEPDFVARAAAEPGKRRRHLLIEFKGRKAGETSEEEKRRWLVRWCEAVSGRRDGGQDHGEWRLVWIERLGDARRLVAEALRERENA